MHNVRQPFWLIVVFGLFWGHLSQANDYPDFVTLVERYSPAVVSIRAQSEEKGQLRGYPSIPENSPFYDYFKRFFEQLPNLGSQPKTSVGSGFVLSPDGYIVTNAHVVEAVDSVMVGLNNQNELPARVIGKDHRSDIALLKIETEAALPVVKLGDVSKLKVGQWVLAIGSPFGFERTATQGIISALGRNLPRDQYVPFIQSDAAVNPGNSGGPLFNLDGEVIGVNSQIYSRSGGYQGLSFAIPIDVAMDVINQLKNGGKVARGWLGVFIQEVTPELAQSFNLDRPRGALVGQVMKDSPAQKAGVATGDIIVRFNEKKIGSSSELPLMVGRARPGTEQSMVVIRNGKEKTLTVQIGELPDEPKRQQAIAESPIHNQLGVLVDGLSDDQRKKGQTGVQVKRLIDGVAARAGIRAGDIITHINNEAVTDVQQFATLVKKLPTGRPVPVLVTRGDGALFIAVTVPADKN